MLDQDLPLKILAMDLDGTAISDDGFFGERTQRAFVAAKESNYCICFVSGRNEIDMYKLGETSQLADFHILNNGGKTIDVRNQKEVFNLCPDERDYRALVTFCTNHGFVLHIIDGMEWYANHIDSRIAKYIKHLGLSPKIYSTFSDVDHLQPEGFVAYGDGLRIIDYIEESNMDLYAIESEPLCYNIQVKSATKWNGLSKLANILNLKKHDIIAVGNYTNDIDMIQNAGIGIAVQNALDSVKLAADYVTQKDYNSDAISEVVETFIIERTLEEAGY